MIHELRIYHCVPGRIPELSRRFETITLKLFEKHGIKTVGFWTVLIGQSNQDFYYMLEWNDLAHREQIWNSFMADGEWLTAKAETEKNGLLVASVTNIILTPTTYSRLK